MKLGEFTTAYISNTQGPGCRWNERNALCEHALPKRQPFSLLAGLLCLVRCFSCQLSLQVALMMQGSKKALTLQGSGKVLTALELHIGSGAIPIHLGLRVAMAGGRSMAMLAQELLLAALLAVVLLAAVGFQALKPWRLALQALASHLLGQHCWDVFLLHCFCCF